MCRGRLARAENNAGGRDSPVPRARACRTLGAAMMAIIDGEAWAADGQPALHEAHGELVSGDGLTAYGHFLTGAEETAAKLAVYLQRHSEQAELPF